MEEKKQKTLFRIPITGCLEIILLLALCGICINECQRSKIRLKRDKLKYEYIIDSIKNTIKEYQ